MIYVQRLLKMFFTMGILLGIVLLGVIVGLHHPWLGAGVIIIGSLTFGTVLWVRWWHSDAGRRFRIIRDKWNQL